MSLKSKIESLLFITTRPLDIKKISELTGGKKDEVKKEITNLFDEYNQKDKGINIQKIGTKYQMVTNANNAKIISEFLKEEMTGELTQASLETLTVIAYRGPITKTELEMIRGVNCSVILRNLMIRGLVDEIDDKKDMVKKYQIAFDFMQHLGITESEQLPEYEKLNSNESLQKLLNNESGDEQKEE
ncbi:MAG: SMC-Scp complex subunit ScpB [Candidatus Buchananbacteria bacterium]|nr:SMC-Scp complex subunit ScpB [Candidatus Buchananbacteria bacterium]